MNNATGRSGLAFEEAIVARQALGQAMVGALRGDVTDAAEEDDDDDPTVVTID